jgi:hypothetical protein
MSLCVGPRPRGLPQRPNQWERCVRGKAAAGVA